MPRQRGAEFAAPIRAKPIPVAARGLIAVSVGVLALAIIKPWSALSPAGPVLPPLLTTPARVAASTPASPTDPPPAVGPDEIACAPAGWQLVTLDRLASWTVRTWTPAAPVAASGPSDPAIPTVRLESPSVLSIGVCAPNQPGSDVPGLARTTIVVAAWTVSAQTARPIAVVTGEAGGLDPRLVRLYAPDAVRKPASSWPPGRYVLELAPFANGGQAVAIDGTSPRWFIAVVVPSPGSAA